MKKCSIYLVTLLLLLAPALSSAKVGTTPAPEFTLNDAKGNAVSLNEFRGKVVFLNFWASWCAPCKKEFPEINELADSYDPSEVAVLAINIDKKHSHATDFLKTMGSLSENLTVLFDPEAVVIPMYKARAMPTSFVIDGAGIIRHIHFGYNAGALGDWAVEIDDLLDETTTGDKGK